MNDYKYFKNAYNDNTNRMIKENYQQSSSNIQEKCPEGYYCPVTPLIPIICRQGLYCPKNSKNPIICPSDRPKSPRFSKSINDCTK